MKEPTHLTNDKTLLNLWEPALRRFADLVAKNERYKCRKLYETLSKSNIPDNGGFMDAERILRGEKSVRVGDLEFHVRKDGRNDTPEIVQWVTTASGDEDNFTLVQYEKNEFLGYEAQFIGRRAMDYNNSGALWNLMHYAQAVLDAAEVLLDDEM